MVVQIKAVHAQLADGGRRSQKLSSQWLGSTEETASRFWRADTRQTPKRVASRNESNLKMWGQCCKRGENAVEIQQDKTKIGEVEVADDIEHSAVGTDGSGCARTTTVTEPSTSPMTR